MRSHLPPVAASPAAPSPGSSAGTAPAPAAASRSPRRHPGPPAGERQPRLRARRCRLLPRHCLPPMSPTWPRSCPSSPPGPETTWTRWQLSGCHHEQTTLRAVQGAPCHRGGKERLRQGTGTPSRPARPPGHAAQGCFGPPGSWWPPHSPQGGQNQRGSPQWATVEVPCARVLAADVELSPAERDPVSYRAGGAQGRQGGLPLPRGAALLSACRLAWRRCLQRHRGGGDVTSKVASLLSDPLPCWRAPGPLGTPARSRGPGPGQPGGGAARRALTRDVCSVVSSSAGQSGRKGKSGRFGERVATGTHENSVHARGTRRQTGHTRVQVRGWARVCSGGDAHVCRRGTRAHRYAHADTRRSALAVHTPVLAHV